MVFFTPFVEEQECSRNARYSVQCGSMQQYVAYARNPEMKIPSLHMRPMHRIGFSIFQITIQVSLVMTLAWKYVAGPHAQRTRERPLPTVNAVIWTRPLATKDLLCHLLERVRACFVSHGALQTNQQKQNCGQQLYSLPNPEAQLAEHGYRSPGVAGWIPGKEVSALAGDIIIGDTFIKNLHFTRDHSNQQN